MVVLTIDDSATLRKIISMNLRPAGYTVEEAENGKAGLVKLASVKPDCIILDINMPEMGGIEFLAERKKNPAYTNIPVIVLTTQDEESVRGKALELGAKGFLAKPFDKDQLIAAINKAVS